MFTYPVQFVNKCLDSVLSVLFENALAPVLLGLLVAAILVAFFVKIFR